jgi:RNA polymerase sigma-70 factor (ECF subfamily)
MESSVPVHDSEEYLVQQAIKRDQVAFTALYERHVDRVYRHVYYKISNHHDAEDITQEAFAKAWKGIDHYKTTGAPFVSWLIAIAGNLVIDHFRREQNIVITNELPEPDLQHQEPGPEIQIELDFNNSQIKKAVLKLNGDKQKVILMHFIDDMNYEEIARAMNKSEGAIRIIQYRALSDLRRTVRRD